MKFNYADRRNDKNIIRKRFKILDSNNTDYKGKIALIQLEEVKNNFIAQRPDGSSEIVINKNYFILTFFPVEDSYCMSVMFDNNCKPLQWYFDITKGSCKYDSGIPYGEDMYLDVVVLPNGEYYTLDDKEIEDALKKNIITKDEYDRSYACMNNIKQMLDNHFQKIRDFTKESFKILSDILGDNDGI